MFFVSVAPSFSELVGMLSGVGTRFWEHSSELALWTFSIVVFSILIFKFYRFVAKRDLFSHPREWNLQAEIWHKSHGKFWGAFLTQGIFLPFLLCLWFAGFAFVLFFLATDFSVELVALISVTLVAAIRITAYYNEEISITLAELMPYWLLGTVLVSPNVFSFDVAIERLSQAGDLVPDIVSFFIFVILVEWSLRILLFLKHALLGAPPAKKESPKN